MNAAVHEIHADPDFGPSIDPQAAEAGTSWYQEPSGDEGGELAADSPLRPVVGGFLILLAVLWTGAVAWAAGQAASGGAPGSAEFVRWTAVASGPLALIGLGWLLFGRSSRNETVRFTRSVQTMRAESEALQSVLVQIERQISGNRVVLAEESARLMNLGEEAADRLGAVTRDVDAGAQAMARYADQLDRAAGSARTDMGVLLADIPRAEAQTRAMSELLRATGIDAHAQAGALEAQIGALALRSREADEAAGGAAGRLTAHIAQVESAAETATRHMEQATAMMSAGVDATLGKAAEAIDASRRGLDEQGQAMLAMIDQSRAAMDRASDEAASGLAARVADVGGRVHGLAALIAEQDAAARVIVEAVDLSMAGMEARLAGVGADGEARLASLGATVGAVREHVDALQAAVGIGDALAGELAVRGEALKAVVSGIGGDLDDRLPRAFAEIEAGAERSRAIADGLAPQVAALAEATVEAQARLDAAASAVTARLGEAGANAQTRLGEAEGLITRQSEALDGLVARQDEALGALLDKLNGGVEAVQSQIGGLSGTMTETDAQAEKLVRDTGPQLIESLLRVREAAMQATERAREAISTAIPDAAAKLGDATGAAMHAAITGQVAAQMSELGTLTEQAVDAARGASERLTRQMLAIGETTAAVEARIAEAQQALSENDHENFSRRVALLIESLNSTAIDVAKILSNDVTDNTWAQYLKGDRGVFTRRAVRLLDNGEAREIARHYEEEPEFREQVNRYVHDFEALLRRVLAERDGSPLGVTLLSSDMGKLYVALAQAIERLRG